MFVASSVSTSCVIPAWWCKATAVKSKANAAVAYVKFSGYEFPCVVNTKILKPGDEVIRFPQVKVKTTVHTRKLVLESVSANNRR